MIGDLDLPRTLSVISDTLARLPRNRALWAYTISGLDGSPYLTRALGPRVLGRRVLLHRIHRPDADRYPHDHPWRWARFRILCGGYLEERVRIDGETTLRWLTAGDVNILDAGTYHRLVHVLPDTWTLGVVGDRTERDYGFLVDGVHVPHEEYYASIGYRSSAGVST